MEPLKRTFDVAPFFFVGKLEGISIKSFGIT